MFFLNRGSFKASPTNKLNIGGKATKASMQRGGGGGGSISSTLDTALEQQLGRVTAQMGKSSLKTCAADNWAARYPRRNP